MNQPGIFIVGAPKCGTTSLSEYLRTHPGVFVCDPKEPFYFATDLPGARAVTTEEAYRALYASAAPGAACVDASPLYLMSREAIPAIRAFRPDARIIAMFRHPAELIASFHSQCRFSQAEDQADLGAAWELQAERAAGRRIPATCVEPRLLQYREVASLGAQLERLLAVFPGEQVHWIFMEDLRADARKVYEGVLDFLCLAHDERADFAAANRRKESRVELPGFLMKAVLLARQRWAHAPLYQRVVRGAKRLLAKEAAPEPLAPALRARLVNEMAEDIRLLARLTGRDLSRWLDPAARGGG